MRDPPTSVLFRMSPTGAYQTLHTFDAKGHPDGTGVFGMVQAPDGNFYGTTVAGDQLKPFNSVFCFNPVSGQYTILHGFNSPNNNLPNVGASGPTLASDGNLYGLQVGSILYRMTLSGKYQEIGPVSQLNLPTAILFRLRTAIFGAIFSAFPGSFLAPRSRARYGRTCR